jgi:RNA polymerase sigma factor (sigma-70 family)
MATAPVGDVLKQLRRTWLRHDGAELTDGQLLDAYLTLRDEAAFEALVRRHGPMVLGVCRRVLRHAQDAEDAFQATFVVLVRKAAKILPREMVGNWLHGVAYRTALEARAAAARRRARESQVRPMPSLESGPAERWHELQVVLDQELDRLPDRYRLPIVLCELEGKTHKEAARQLGWPQGTVSGRLSRARALLARRLTRHGLALAGGALALALAQQPAAAGVSPSLLTSTVKAATRLTADQAVLTEVVSANVAALTKGVLKRMLLTKLKLKIPLALLLIAGLLAVALAGLTNPALARKPATSPAQTKPNPSPNTARAKPRAPRIVFWENGVVMSVAADGKDLQPHSRDSQKHSPTPLLSLSPDGQRLAYGITAQGEQRKGDRPENIFVRRLDEPGPGLDLQVQGHSWCWSPDGTYLAVGRFEADPKEQLTVHHRLVDVKTKKQEALKLPEGHFLTDWSRDGKWFLTVSGMSYKEPHMQLNLVSRDGSKTHRLTRPALQAFHGCFSPDGRRVLFAAANPKVRYAHLLFVVDVPGGKPRQLTQELNAEIMGYCWSPDGKRIAYVWRQHHDKPAADQVTESFLMAVDADGRNPVTLISKKGLSSGHIVLASPQWR